MALLIKGGRILNPASKQDEIADLLVEDGKIKKVGVDLKLPAEQVFDAAGCFVMPGLIDLHVHLREPGFTHKETIETGALAAAKGGFTTICAMPNTSPVIDCADQAAYVYEKAKSAVVHVIQAGAVTKGQMGEELADIAQMAEAGIGAISEDGKSVMNAKLYAEGMLEAKKAGIPVFAHCEDKNLVGKGALNAGKKAEELNVEGITNAVEDVIAARDILLAKDTGVKLHLCHCSTKDSVAMIRAAKEEGLPVTGEVCPHHFTLCDEDIIGADTNYKMNPPLRAKEDVEALKAGLRDDIMDVISTDHAPHHEDEKKKGMEEAPFGIVGLETAVPLTITELVDKGYLTPMQMAEKMSYQPAKILGIDKGNIEEGKTADITVIDPEAEFEINALQFASKGKNTPFHGRKVKGKVMLTIVDGMIAYKEEE